MKVRIAGDRLVEIVDIRLVVLAVVEVDGLARNMGLQRSAFEGQGRQFDGHGGSSRSGLAAAVRVGTCSGGGSGQGLQ